MNPPLPPFDRVVAEHGATVMRVCRAVLGPVDADDAWSETFLAALRAYPRLRPDSNVVGWLTTIAHRKAIDQLRRRARTPVPSDALPEPAALDDEPLVERDGDLWGDLQGLTLKQRTAIAYHHLAGLPYAEIAALTGGTEAAVRRAAADGVARLRQRRNP